MNEPRPSPTAESSDDFPPPVRHLKRKATLLLFLLLLLVVGSVLYLLHARGVFDRTQRLVLVAEDAEGVLVGMDMTFAGFAIGRVARIELAADGNARILVDVPSKDAGWLRTSSVFTMERALVGGTRIRAFSGVLDDPPLEDGAVRPILRGDALADLPRLTSTVGELLDNLKALTATDAALATSLKHLQDTTEKLKGPQGALAVLLGNDQDARRIVARTHALLARADALSARLDTLLAKTDRQVFGQGAGQAGLADEMQSTVKQLNGLLADARGSLRQVDAVLAKAQDIAGNVREASADLGALRGEVDTTLRKVDHLVNEIHRKWPLARDTEIKLP